MAVIFARVELKHDAGCCGEGGENESTRMSSSDAENKPRALVAGPHHSSQHIAGKLTSPHATLHMRLFFRALPPPAYVPLVLALAILVKTTALVKR